MERQSPVIWFVLSAAGAGAALITYVGGDPAWISALLLFAVPAVWIVRKIKSRPMLELSSFMRRYRILLIIYGTAVVLTVCEMRLRGTFPRVLVHSFPRLVEDSPGDADLVLEPGEANYADALAELYSSRPEAMFAQGFQAKLCMEREWLRPEPSDVCDKFVGKELDEVRRYYERALATGIKSNEALFNSYAEILIKLDEDEAKINAALAQLYRNFPEPKLPDPREAKRDGQ